jgi:diguanylate cyclase (GGDEF)-like protein
VQVSEAPAAVERPPRLVLRFALLTAVCLGLGAAAILAVTRHIDTMQAEQAATRQAELMGGVLVAELRASDLRAPVSAARREALDRIFDRAPLARNAVSVVLATRSGVVTYATPGTVAPSRLDRLRPVRDAVSGTITSSVTQIDDPLQPGRRLKVLQSYVPVALPGATGVAVIDQDYGPIGRDAHAAFLPVAGILEAVLLALFVLLVPVMARVTRRLRRQMERIRHQAHHDDLTGLPNRAGFAELAAPRLFDAWREASNVAVILLDVDRFKEINDALGHASGDRLLVAVAERLGGVLDGRGSLARLGGDEFAVLMPRAGAPEAAAFADLLRGALDEPIEVDGVPLAVAASAGVAVHPEHGLAADLLVQRADVAMSTAKRRRTGVELYDPAVDTSDAGRLALVAELRDGLERGEVELHYQPQVDMRTGLVAGVEALARWRHPRRGLLLPGEFVSVAEHTGASRALTGYVLDRVVRQAARWASLGVPVPVAANLSMVDLLDLSLPDEVEALLAREGLDADLLELELTESAMMGDPARVRTVVSRLHELGVRIAIDDFGTGYSSLTYLKRLPVEVIKIDRSFVSCMLDDESDRAIVRSTVDLAHNLGLTVVGEGVETREHWEALQGLGCDVAQGWFLGMPAPAEATTALLLRDGGEIVR